MTRGKESFSAARRRLLKLFGLGAGAAFSTIIGSERLFARQFLGEGVEIKTPKMTYDPDLQMMVDPETRRPIYTDPKQIQLATPVVTAGCADCPKRDDCKDDMC